MRIEYNELHRALNCPEGFVLALVEVDRGSVRLPRYVRDCSFCEPDPLALSVNSDLDELLSRSEEPY